jgi:hypothetical protein
MKNKTESFKTWIPIITGLAGLLIPIFSMEARKWLIDNWSILIFCISLFSIAIGIISWWVRHEFNCNWEKVEKNLKEIEVAFKDESKQLTQKFTDLQATFTDVAIINSLNTLLIRDIVLAHIGYNDDLIKALIDKNFTKMDLDMLGEEINAEFKRKFNIKLKEKEIEKMKG